MEQKEPDASLQEGDERLALSQNPATLLVHKHFHDYCYCFLFLLLHFQSANQTLTSNADKAHLYYQPLIINDQFLDLRCKLIAEYYHCLLEISIRQTYAIDFHVYYHT